MSAQRLTVLLVEDDESLAEVTMMLLEEAGYVVVTAAHGGLALELLQRCRPDTIVLDMMMPEVDGLEFLQRLPHEMEPPLPPVLACSGFDALQTLALDRGARAFLQKPYSAEDLLGNLKTLIQGSQPSPQVRKKSHDGCLRLREEAAAKREALLAGTPLPTKVRGECRSLVAWLTGYFGAVRAFVTLFHGGDLHVLAECGGFPETQEGGRLDPSLAFCPKVVAASTCLLLCNATTHPGFSECKAAAVSPFYAGAPLLTEGGVALGTLCVEDFSSLDFRAEDSALLGHFATILGNHMVGSTSPCATHPPPLFVVPDVFHAEASCVLLAAELRRAERDCSALELVMMTVVDPTPQCFGDLAAAALRATGRRHAAISVRTDGLLALLLGDATSEAVALRSNAIMADPTVRGSIRAIGAASFTGCRGGPASVSDLERTAREALARSTGGSIERIEILAESRPEPARPPRGQP